MSNATKQESSAFRRERFKVQCLTHKLDPHGIKFGEICEAVLSEKMWIDGCTYYLINGSHYNPAYFGLVHALKKCGCCGLEYVNYSGEDGCPQSEEHTIPN